METLFLVMPSAWLVRIAVAGVWIYEGLWCKILGRNEDELRVVEAVPRYGEKFGRAFLTALGWVELLLGVWVLSSWAPGLCALAQTVLLVTLNANGLLWSRHLSTTPAAWCSRTSRSSCSAGSTRDWRATPHEPAGPSQGRIPECAARR